MSKINLIEKIVDGKHISPVLPNEIKNYLIDIDGTICDDIPNEEPERMATTNLYPDALKTLNKWHKEGHYITFFTSIKWLSNPLSVNEDTRPTLVPGGGFFLETL